MASPPPAQRTAPGHHWKFAADLAARVSSGAPGTGRHLHQGRPDLQLGGYHRRHRSGARPGREDHGPALAVATARDLVVYLKRAGSRRQYSEPLRFQAQAGDRFADFGRLDDRASGRRPPGVESLADRVHLSPRQFSRRFVATSTEPGPAGREPAARPRRLRLTGSPTSIETIADAVDFRSADAFGRAFDRPSGWRPTFYRRRFASANGPPGIRMPMPRTLSSLPLRSWSWAPLPARRPSRPRALGASPPTAP